eukprot:147536-Chlamydomonas_euryale.AAC.2
MEKADARPPSPPFGVHCCVFPRTPQPLPVGVHCCVFPRTPQPLPVGVHCCVFPRTPQPLPPSSRCPHTQCLVQRLPGSTTVAAGPGPFPTTDLACWHPHGGSFCPTCCRNCPCAQQGGSFCPTCCRNCPCAQHGGSSRTSTGPQPCAAARRRPPCAGLLHEHAPAQLPRRRGAALQVPQAPAAAAAAIGRARLRASGHSWHTDRAVCAARHTHTQDNAHACGTARRRGECAGAAKQAGEPDCDGARPARSNGRRGAVRGAGGAAAAWAALLRQLAIPAGVSGGVGGRGWDSEVLCGDVEWGGPIPWNPAPLELYTRSFPAYLTFKHVLSPPPPYFCRPPLLEYCCCVAGGTRGDRVGLPWQHLRDGALGASGEKVARPGGG